MEKAKIIETVSLLAEEALASTPDYFLVEVRMSPSQQLKVFVDADHGASIDRLASLNRALYHRIEEAALFGPDGNFSLEVSSPGLDEPLKLLRQYKKNIGRRVEVTLADGTLQTGTLDGADGENVRLTQQEGPKKEPRTLEKEIPFNQIKSTKVCVVF